MEGEKMGGEGLGQCDHHNPFQVSHLPILQASCNFFASKYVLLEHMIRIYTTKYYFNVIQYICT